MHDQHKSSYTPEYNSYHNMKQRCLNPTNPSYSYYGGRGIKICKRWLEDGKGFSNFLEDMGRKPGPSYSIDRYPNQDGNYEPSNCRWADTIQQRRNTKRIVEFTYKGQTKLVADWAKELGINSGTLLHRVKSGRSTRDVISKDRLKSRGEPPRKIQDEFSHIKSRWKRWKMRRDREAKAAGEDTYNKMVAADRKQWREKARLRREKEK